MRFPLRWKILIAVVVAPVMLAAGAVLLLNHNVSEHALGDIQDDLQRASLAFENTLDARYATLAATGEVIARDPRFFAVMALPAGASNRYVRATVAGVARDFQKVARSDLFEVLDQRGAMLASVGPASTTKTERAWIVEAARRGKATTGLLVEGKRQYQVAVIPLRVHGARAGALVLGFEIGATLARQLQVLTRSDVTFVSNGAITSTTLEPDIAGDTRLTDWIASDPIKTTAHTPQTIEANDQQLLTIVRPIRGAASGGRQFYVMQRSLEAETVYVRKLQARVLGLGLIAIAASVAIGLFVSTRITRPILSVVRGAEEMERGNYDHPVTVRSRDEIGYLAQRFSDMRRHEQVYVSSLREIARLKSEFIDVASHELRTPVSVIQGYSELFGQGRFGPLTSEQRGALQVIDESVRSLVRVSEDATRVAQIEGDRMILYKEPHDVGRLLEDAAKAALAAAVGRTVEVTVDVAPGLEAQNIDGPRVLQAVLQLVRNGIRFTPDGGRVDIAAWLDQDVLVIEVADTGIGIPEDRLPSLFQHVVVVRDALRHHSSNALEFDSAGLGLGLSIARGIVDAHGGSMTVTSTLGVGSRFTLRIPPTGEIRHRASA